MKLSGVLLVLILIAAVVSGCLSGSGPESEKPAAAERTVTAGSSGPKENSEAGVTITAVYLGNNAFDISMDTHSGSLDYEMAKISYIRDSTGNIIRPEAWNGGIGGHHFRGTLTFPKFDDRAGFELVIQDVAGVKERIIKW